MLSSSTSSLSYLQECHINTWFNIIYTQLIIAPDTHTHMTLCYHGTVIIYRLPHKQEFFSLNPKLCSFLCVSLFLIVSYFINAAFIPIDIEFSGSYLSTSYLFKSHQKLLTVSFKP